MKGSTPPTAPVSIYLSVKYSVCVSSRYIEAKTEEQNHLLIRGHNGSVLSDIMWRTGIQLSIVLCLCSERTHTHNCAISHTDC